MNEWNQFEIRCSAREQEDEIKICFCLNMPCDTVSFRPENIPHTPDIIAAPLECAMNISRRRKKRNKMKTTNSRIGSSPHSFICAFHFSLFVCSGLRLAQCFFFPFLFMFILNASHLSRIERIARQIKI